MFWFDENEYLCDEISGRCHLKRYNEHTVTTVKAELISSSVLILYDILNESIIEQLEDFKENSFEIS